MSIGRHTVVLLRSPSTDTPDRYESVLSSAGYNSVSIPVLETGLTNLNHLTGILLKGPQDAYSGVIITSARACEAWKAVVESVIMTPPSRENAKSSWSTIPFYVVGPSTAASLSSLHTHFSSYKHAKNFVPSLSMIRGQESGNDETLSRFILRDLDKDRSRLLYLTGDKNRATLPAILTEGGVELHPVQVYETRGSSTFKDDLRRVIDTSTTNEEWWIVFFAPSAAQFVTPALEQDFKLPRANDVATVASSNLLKARLAAIGPTTLAFLRDTLHLRVLATASKPTPEGLLLAIQQANSEATDVVA